jgi:hypothetical protein
LLLVIQSDWLHLFIGAELDAMKAPLTVCRDIAASDGLIGQDARSSSSAARNGDGCRRRC